MSSSRSWANPSPSRPTALSIVASVGCRSVSGGIAGLSGGGGQDLRDTAPRLVGRREHGQGEAGVAATATRLPRRAPRSGSTAIDGELVAIAEAAFRRADERGDG